MVCTMVFTLLLLALLPSTQTVAAQGHYDMISVKSPLPSKIGFLVVFLQWTCPCWPWHLDSALSSSTTVLHCTIALWDHDSSARSVTFTQTRCVFQSQLFLLVPLVMEPCTTLGPFTSTSAPVRASAGLSARLVPEFDNMDIGFGFSIGGWEDFVAVGAPNMETEGGVYGGVYIYRCQQGNCNQTQVILPVNNAGFLFGW